MSRCEVNCGEIENFNQFHGQVHFISYENMTLPQRLLDHSNNLPICRYIIEIEGAARGCCSVFVWTQHNVHALSIPIR